MDVENHIDKKTKMLSKHKSQKEWLNVSQCLDAYIDTMREMSAQIGKLSRKFNYAEGWIRHSHLGFCDEYDNPLQEALKD